MRTSMKYELEKNEMELLYHFARETNLLYLSDKFKDKFDKDTIEELDLLFSKIYKNMKVILDKIIHLYKI